MTDDDVRTLVGLGREQRRVEFKQGGSLEDKRLRASVFRAIMAMANLSDGGIVLIGVTEDGDLATITGFSDEHLSTWRQDDLASKLRPYAEPPPEFTLDKVQVDGNWCVVVHVEQFASVPVLCSQNENIQEGKKSIQLLRGGACYVRSQGSKPESAPVATAAEMRELLDLATARSLRSFIATASAANLRVQSPGPSLQQVKMQQVRSLFSHTASVIHERGFWRVEIVPFAAVQPVAHPHELIAVVDACRVVARGYGYPSSQSLDAKSLELVADGLRVESLNPFHKDSWKLWNDGCFGHERSMWIDWQDQGLTPPAVDWKPGERLSVEESIYFATEAFEFAARLSQSVVGAAQYFIRLSLPRLHGRRLATGERLRLRRDHESIGREWSSRGPVIDRDQLIARRHELALDAMLDLFLYFDWKPSIDVLRSIQQEIPEFRRTS